MPRQGRVRFGNLWEPRRGGTELAVSNNRLTYVKADDEARVAEIEAIQAASDTVRTESASRGGQTLQEYDDELEDEWAIIKDRIDYYNYPTRVENTTVANGDWYSPIAVNSECGESGPNVSENSIDLDDATVWRHVEDHRHSIVYELRAYPKVATKIRFRYNTTEPLNEQLANLDIHIAKALPRIDDAENIIATGVNIVWPTGQGTTWVEYDLGDRFPKARWIKLVFDTAQAQNTGQIRDFQVWVSTRKDQENI